MTRVTLTHALLAAIFIALAVLVLSPPLLPAAHAAAPGQTPILGCHVKYAGAGCTWIPVAVDSEGRLLVSMK